MNIFKKMYYELDYMINERFDFKHIIDFAIGFTGGIIAYNNFFNGGSYFVYGGYIALFMFIDLAFHHLFNIRPEKEIVIQAKDEGDTEFLKRIETTITDTINGEDIDE